MHVEQLEKLITHLVDIGCALSSEKNLGVLLAKIVDEARLFAAADGGTLYLMSEDRRELEWAIVQNKSMDIRKGGSDTELTADAFKPIALYNEFGEPDMRNVAAYVAHKGAVVSIDDVYDKTDGFDFSGPKRFDAATGYRTKSMLVVPLSHFEGGVIGVLQLINASDHQTGDTIAFDKKLEGLMRSLASQAAVAIKNAELFEELEIQFEAFIRSIATAIDAKSPYTAGHVERVVDITMRIAGALNQTGSGKYASTDFSEDELKALRIAAWMHDIGKITTPEFVVDKATKLETIYDRIELVRERFGRLIAEAQLAKLQAVVDGDNAAKSRAEETAVELAEALEFIEQTNPGKEFMHDDDVARVDAILARGWLTEDEAYNLNIRRGTLTHEEREVIKDHASVSLRMLKALPFSRHLADVPEIAASHHEKLNGKGYPRGLAAEQLDIKARILAVADIFEALSAGDRPYRNPMPLSQVLRILGFMVGDGDLDRELVNFAITSGVFDHYAIDEISEAQRDIIISDHPLAAEHT